MTIANTKAKTVYSGNGVTRNWELGFSYDKNVSNLEIVIENPEGNYTLVETNYSVVNDILTYPTTESGLEPLQDGYKLVLIRKTPNTQELNIQSKVEPEPLEKSLDKITLQIQEIAEQVDRAIKVPVSENGLDNYKDPIKEIEEEREKALEEIETALEPISASVATAETQAILASEYATKATEESGKAEQYKNISQQASVIAQEASAEAVNAVSAFNNGLGTMRNAVIDLGVFEKNQSIASSCIIDFDFEPLDAFVRFTDASKKMWIKGSHSTAGIEKVGDRKYKIFYSVSSEDFDSQSNIKGPFYVQFVIKYSVWSGKPVLFKGRVDTVEELPEEGEDGDLYYVGSVDAENKQEYIWYDGKFELVGSTSREDYDSLHNDLDELGDQVAEIESKIPQGTSDTNSLINKQQLFEEEMELRSDMMQSDSELQTQINALAEAIQGGGGSAGSADVAEALRNQNKAEGATENLYNWVGTLAEYEAQNIATEHPDWIVLITDDGDAGTGGGGGSVPDNVYTQDNLVAGHGIEFVKETTGGGGLDENTLALWHFDDSLVDVISGIEVTKTRGLTTGGKFGGCIQDQEGEAKLNINDISVLGLTGADTFAYDFWYKRTGTASSGVGYYGLGSATAASTGLQLGVSAAGVLQIKGSAYKAYTDSGNSANIYETVLDTWTHILVQYIGSDKRALVFVDGNKVFDFTGTALSTTFSIAGMIFNRTSSTSGCPALIDEFRITRGIVATENFSVPTEPYGTSKETGKTKINSTITKLSQLENDSLTKVSQLQNDASYAQTTGAFFTGRINSITENSGGNAIGLAVKQDWVSGNLFPPFIEGRTGINTDKVLGRAGFQQTAANKANFFIQTYDPSTNKNKGGALTVGYDGAAQTNYVRGITPPYTSNSTDFATTAWAKGLMDPYKEIALLWSGNINEGDCSLSEPFTNFYQLLITYSGDDQQNLGKALVNVGALHACLNDQNFEGAVLLDRYLYWNIKTYKNGSTTTLFKHLNNNCRLWAIQGVYRK